MSLVTPSRSARRPGNDRASARLPGTPQRVVAARAGGLDSGAVADLAIEAVDLVKRYDSATALDGLSFTAGTARVTTVLGPNGAGKTTAVEICEGFRKADSGSVHVLGCDPRRDAGALKPRVGVMLQSGGVPAGARAGEMLRLVAALHARPVDPEVLLERLGLRGAARTTYRQLSGGQRQRLSLAMAVVGRPELVFLDEPTAGLDPQARLAAWELMAELRASGVTVVLTTHHMEEAERLADHVVILDRGNVVAAGTPHSLTSSGSGRQVRFETSPGLDLDELLTEIPAGSKATEGPAGHYLIEGDVGPEVLAAVTAWCAAHGALTRELRIESRTLEDVFLELTGQELRG